MYHNPELVSTYLRAIPSFQSVVRLLILQLGRTAWNQANSHVLSCMFENPIWYLRIICHISASISFKLPSAMSELSKKIEVRVNAGVNGTQNLTTKIMVHWNWSPLSNCSVFNGRARSSVNFDCQIVDTSNGKCRKKKMLSKV